MSLCYVGLVTFGVKEYTLCLVNVLLSSNLLVNFFQKFQDTHVLHVQSFLRARV